MAWVWVWRIFSLQTRQPDQQHVTGCSSESSNIKNLQVLCYNYKKSSGPVGMGLFTMFTGHNLMDILLKNTYSSLQYDVTKCTGIIITSDSIGWVEQRIIINRPYFTSTSAHCIPVLPILTPTGPLAHSLSLYVRTEAISKHPQSTSGMTESSQ